MLTVEELKRELRPLLVPSAGADASRDDTAREAWLDALALRLENGRLVVGFPHSYFARWFSTHKRTSFEAALFRCFPDAPGIIYEDAPLGRALPPMTEVFRTVRDAAPAGIHGSGSHGETPDDSGEDAFARFIVNARNAFPLATAKKIAGEGFPDGEAVLLFCGKSGTGKTQLLRAMAVTLGRRLAPERVLMRGAARFCADMAAGGAAWTEQFWRDCDALLLDDVQDIAGEPASQRDLAACMDVCLHPLPEERRRKSAGNPRCGRLMVFSHAGPATELAHLEERLRTRLESGLVLELLEPDLDVRLRYLQRAVRERELALSREQMLYLAQRCVQFSLLQGLLRKVEAFAALNGRQPMQADLENIVRTGGSVRPVGCREILGSVARGFNLRAEDILGARRRPDLVLARQVAMYLCRRKLGLSYPELGRAFGGRDHSTVIHAVKKIRKLLDTDKVVHNLVTELENAVP
ncbi:helix-turn-helix domain-containing protein [uncultured Desulfovibrio sp.]|uniref:helix-turn-helix domain-containing protein n=1 Tax=uncultured Desulfovibrio sp. TaxID=167968 RepID=UPI00280569BC|nr:helix-turn-helix domain-containing protein [uncultured Desulfovibrio sp.]